VVWQLASGSGGIHGCLARGGGEGGAEGFLGF